MTGLAADAGTMRELLMVAVDRDRIALAVGDVREVQRAAAPAPLPNAPKIVGGVLNVRGELVPILNIRQRLGREDRPLRVSDHIIVARASDRLVAFAVDQVLELVRIPESDITAAAAVVAGTAHLAGVAALPDGVLVIHDLGQFLTTDELFALDHALDGAKAS